METDMFKLFIMLSLIRAVVRGQVLTFPRCNANSLTMSFVYANPAQNPYDLFATGRNNTCGKRAGTATGSGTYADPFVLTIDFSKGVNLQTPDCGGQQTGATNFRVTVRAVFSATGPTVNDTDYTIDCDNLVPRAATSTSPAPSTTPVPKVSRSATYTCQAPSVILFTYFHSALASPFNIYAVGRETTCSRSSGKGSGSGIAGDPYVLSIDVSDGTNTCGASVNGSDTYSLVMYVQQLADIITVADVSYALTCNFTSVASQIISAASLPAASKIPIGEAAIDQPAATLYVVSSPAGSVLTSFSVGDDIRLSAQLQSGPASGLRVRQCTVSPGPGLTQQIAILDQNGCSTARNLVSPFMGQSPSGAQGLTGVFDAFKFTKYDTVYFQCRVDFCYTAADTNCLGPHCNTGAGRRKRDVNDISKNYTVDVIAAYVTVRGDDSANIKDLSVVQPPPKDLSANDNCYSFARSNVVAVASLASTLSAAFLVSLGLALRLRAVTSRSQLSPPERLPGRENQCEVITQPSLTSLRDARFSEKGL